MRSGQRRQDVQIPRDRRYDLMQYAFAKDVGTSAIITSDAVFADIGGNDDEFGHIKVQLTGRPPIDLLGGGTWQGEQTGGIARSRRGACLVPFLPPSRHAKEPTAGATARHTGAGRASAFRCPTRDLDSARRRGACITMLSSVNPTLASRRRFRLANFQHSDAHEQHCRRQYTRNALRRAPPEHGIDHGPCVAGEQ